MVRFDSKWIIPVILYINRLLGKSTLITIKIIVCAPFYPDFSSFTSQSNKSFKRSKNSLYYRVALRA